MVQRSDFLHLTWLLENDHTGELDGSTLNAANTCLQGPAFGTSASVYDKQRVVATASGPTFATEDKTVHIFLLTGALSSFYAGASCCACCHPTAVMLCTELLPSSMAYCAHSNHFWWQDKI